MQSNVRDGVLFRSPQDEAERATVAGACVRKLGIKFPALIDSFDTPAKPGSPGWPDGLSRIGGGGGFFTRASPDRSDSIRMTLRPRSGAPDSDGTDWLGAFPP